MSLIRVLAFEALRYATLVWTTALSYWARFWDWYTWTPVPRPTTQYFLGSDDAYDGTQTTVPAGMIYIEDWVWNGQKKCVVRYEGETIPTSWEQSPHTQHAKCPWIWVGDRNTEIDLTHTFLKFLVPGNRITPALIERLTNQTNLVYIEFGSFEEKKFPSEGLLIKANGPL
jgi:hypothetical protein